MILVDTSVWIEHLRSGDLELARLLEDGQILTHPFVTGELALGNLQRRELILSSFQSLPQAQVASHDEMLLFIDQERLFGSGIGYTDAHLLAAVRLTPGVRLWTHDKRLASIAVRLGMSA